MAHCVSTHHGTHYLTNIGIQHLKSVRCKSFGRKDIWITVHIHTFTHICKFTCEKTYVCAYVNINLVGEQFDFVDGNKCKLNGKVLPRIELCFQKWPFLFLNQLATLCYCNKIDVYDCEPHTGYMLKSWVNKVFVFVHMFWLRNKKIIFGYALFTKVLGYAVELFLINYFEHKFWVLNRTVSLRWFFWVPITYVLAEK